MPDITMCKNDKNENKAEHAQLGIGAVSGSLFSSPFKKIPIIISKWNDNGCKGWRAEIADNYENYKSEKYDNINFEDLSFHFKHSVNTHELDHLVFYTRKDAVKCAKEVMETEKLNCKIWFL